MEICREEKSYIEIEIKRKKERDRDIQRGIIFRVNLETEGESKIVREREREESK